MKYTNEQRAFVDARAERLILEAPAGTGKTEIVAERVRVLAEEGKRVKLICFTNASKRTLQKRLDDAGVKVKVQTVTSLAVEVLLAHVGRDAFTIGDGAQLATEVSVRGVVTAKQVKEFEGLIANGAPLPASMPSVVAGVFKDYQELKVERSYLSFIDVVLMATGMRSYGWDELIVDEAQDLTPIQMDFLRSCEPRAITLVGDSLQAIYGFSGVDASMFGNLAHGGWTRLELSETFRVPVGVLPAVNAVRPHPLRSKRSGGAVALVEAPFAAVAERLAKILEPGDCVVATTTRKLERVASYVENLTNTPISRSWMGLPTGEPVVHFSTIHSAKGGEWSRVFVLDIGEHGLTASVDVDPLENQRLFYVAVSRALDELVLVKIGDALPWGLDSYGWSEYRGA